MPSIAPVTHFVNNGAASSVDKYHVKKAANIPPIDMKRDGLAAAKTERIAATTV